VTSHSLTLTGLSRKTVYYFRVSSKDGAGNTATSPVPPATNSFKTNPGGGVLSLQASKGSIKLQWAPILEQGSDSGYFGIKTYAAVKQFQCQQNIVCSGTSKLTEWGMVGPRTRQRINELGQGISPSPLPSPSGSDLSTVQILQSQLALLLQQLAVLQGR
jgi:peptidoglycan hydrolase-like protein with peptidoglycan-binding domain